MKSDFSKFLRRLLEEKSVSLRKLGKISGIDHATLSKIMNGKRNVNFTHLQKLSTSLDLDLNTLIEAAGFTNKEKTKNDGNIQESVELIQTLMTSSEVPKEDFTLEKIEKQIIDYKNRSVTKDGKKYILHEFQNKLIESRGTGPFITQLKTFFTRFSTGKGTTREIALMGAALLYFIITTDLIPDYLIPIGLLDDALIMQTISQQMENKKAL